MQVHSKPTIKGVVSPKLSRIVLTTGPQQGAHKPLKGIFVLKSLRCPDRFPSQLFFLFASRSRYHCVVRCRFPVSHPPDVWTRTDFLPSRLGRRCMPSQRAYENITPPRADLASFRGVEDNRHVCAGIGALSRVSRTPLLV